VGSDFRIAAWLIQPRLNTVSNNGTTFRLEPKVMEVLVCLAQHAGEPVSKDELLQTVWPKTFVTDDVLKRSISELRRVFEDDIREPRVIQTIPKRGYRLLAPVEPVNGAHGAAIAQLGQESRKASLNWRTLALLSGGAAALLLILLGTLSVAFRERLLGKKADPQIHSIAVLPLQNLSGDPNQEYFSDGLTDTLITDLAHTDSLRVISRTSSMQYKETKKSLPAVARELNVDGIVEGTVQRSGDRVRINVQLIQAASDKHMWANSYERDLRDVFALERDVTEDIARQVQAKLTAPNQAAGEQFRPVNPKALDLYLQGNYRLNEFARGAGDEERRKAAEYFQQAIDADPDFASAYNGLANAHLSLLWPSGQDAGIATEAAERAVALDPNSSDAHLTLGTMREMAWDWAGAEQEYRRAIAVSPRSADAHGNLGSVLDLTGRLDEGWKEQQIAFELDPNNADLFNFTLSSGLEMRGEYDRAIAIYQAFLKRDPDNGFTHIGLARDYLKEAMYKEGMPHLERCWTLFGFPDVADGVHRALATSGYRGAILESAKATEHLIATHKAYVPVNAAEFYATAGDKERAFYWLEQAYSHRDFLAAGTDDQVGYISGIQLLEPLRSDPRFKDLLRRMGLPELQVDESRAGGQQNGHN